MIKQLLLTLMVLAVSTCEVERQEIKQYELPAPLKDRPEQLLRRTGYTASYNSDTRCPNWVACHLTKAHTGGRVQRSAELFTEDGSVAKPRATNDDYYNSRYDRGHMCPAGDNKWDAKAMQESFLLTNVCPQNHGLNKYEWNDVEKLCRQWAQRYGAVDVVCGPLYEPKVQPRFIGRNKVRVPDAFFKVVLCRQGTPKAIGFVFRNHGKKMSVAEAACTVDDVERLTGIDFFPQLEDKVERVVEARSDFTAW
jgi:endonuclease G